MTHPTPHSPPYPTAVIDVVGLSAALFGPHAPNLGAFRERGGLRALRPVLPAVTCAVQSSMLTGRPVREHGIVGNGWYDAESCEVRFWKQSGRLVRAEKVWETARKRDPSVTCLNMFWWYNMYSSADWSVTPRPIYKADGRKIPDVYADPPELRDDLQAKLGRFPLFNFWGPAASIASTRWIAEATMEAWRRHEPTLTLVYLPHLDYALQKLGPAHADIPREVAAVDAVVGDLLRFFDERSVRVMILSEYGIEAVDGAVEPNRALRESGFLRVREEEGLELLDPGASDAFAVADHQVAHVYLRGGERSSPGDGKLLEACRALFANTDGVDLVLDRAAQAAHGIDHERGGDLVLVAEPGTWFAYRYWLDDARAPDFARTVDIHRKPGYDPCELFLDPALALPKLRIAAKLLRKKLGFRTLMDVIPLDPGLVRGSHGRVEQPDEERPVLMTTLPVEGGDAAETGDPLPCEGVRDVILSHLFDPG